MEKINIGSKYLLNNSKAVRIISKIKDNEELYMGDFNGIGCVVREDDILNKLEND